MRVARVISGALLMTLFAGSSFAASVPVPYPDISHSNTGAGDLSAISLRHGQTLRVTIVDTRTKCFTYNGLGLETLGAESLRSGESPGTFKVIDLLHDESFKGYEVKVTKKDPPPAGCESTELKEVRWVIPVKSAWRVAMSGAVTLDGLTDPVFFLEKGKQGEEDGFFVREQSDDEDKVRTAAGAMAHLYNVDWGAWVPLTFGVSLAENPTYLIGTGVRLGEQGQLSIGASVGPRAHLPSQLEVGSFVTDANAINTLGSRTDISFFFSVSLAFFEKNLSKISGIIKPATPPAE